jgi:hypothetical protein
MLGRGAKEGARHVPEARERNRRDRHRYRQELVPLYRPRRAGAVVLRQKWSRGQVEARFANMPPCLIGMEACVGAHQLSENGHQSTMSALAPPQAHVLI